MTTHIERLSLEHYPHPLGIGHSAPRISWRFVNGDGIKDWLQVKYQVEVIKADGTTKQYTVNSEDSVLVPWPAAPLITRERVCMRVRAQGNDGLWTEWAEEYVEAGLMEKEAWSASFATCSPAQDLSASKRPFRLRQTFHLDATHGHLPNARLYITCLGLYEAYLNGVRIGDHVLAPGWTSYDARLPYQTFDISNLIQPGENTLGAWIGEGWFAGRLGYGGGHRNIFGDRPALLAQLELDGRPIESEWQWSYGSIVQAELYNGEKYDTHLPDYDDWSGEEWKPVDRISVPMEKLFSSQSPPIRAVETVKPIEIITTPSGKTIVDFGQNLAGVVRILSHPPSTSDAELVIRHAEVLEHGELGTRPLRQADATDRILLGGTRDLTGYAPRFTFHGFRYAEVTGWPSITLEDLEAVVLQSSMERTGEFTCSHSLINRLHENAVWSTKGNTVGIPSDCPQRDERLGWTGDVCVFSPTMSYLFDSAGFLSEWLQDLWHDQRRLDGVVPIFIPDTGTDVSTPEAIWGDAAVIVPHDVYTASGDVMVMARQFESIKMWLDQGVRRDQRTGLWSRDRDQLGDWLAPRAPAITPNMGPTDNILVADAWLIHSTRTAAKIAKLVGRSDEAIAYNGQVAKLIESFYNEYITASGRVVSETQTALCLLLHFDIFPPKCKSNIDYRALFADRLGHLVTKANWLIDTGFAGTPIVLSTLADHGHMSHAYRMLQATECPSWLSCVLLGATTIWERWDSMLADGTINPGEMTSFNHYALGSVASFMHQYIGGLSPSSAGWKEVLVRPRPGGTITSAATSHVSPYGKIQVEWQLVEGELQMDLVVPPNSSAEVDLPGMPRTSVGSGKHHFTVPFEMPAFPPAIYTPHFAPIRPNTWAA